MNRACGALGVMAIVVGGSLLTTTMTAAAPEPDFLPPNPPAQSVAEGELGFFPLPGLLMAEPAEIKADCTTESGAAFISPPTILGAADSGIEFGIENSTGPQVATCEVLLIGSQSTANYTLVLYYGLPLPTTTTTPAVVAAPLPKTGGDVSYSGAAALALLVLGGGLVVVTRRKARPEF